MPYSIESESPPATSRVVPREDPKRNSPLTPNTVPFEAEKSYWTQEGYGGPYGTRRRTVLHPQADDKLRLWGWTLDEEKRLSPFIPAPYPSTSNDPGKLVFQRACGSPDQASLDSHFEDVGSRPVNGPLDFDLSKVISRGIVSAPSGDP